jgi:hypothetical protein
VPAGDRAAGSDEIVVGATRVALQPSRLVQADRDDFQPPRTGESREDVAIAAVVTRPANDSDTLHRRPAAAQHAERRFSGTSHERVGRNAQVVDRVPVQRAHLVCGVNGDGQAAHARSLPKRILRCA